jgi:hypothetical protein
MSLLLKLSDAVVRGRVQVEKKLKKVIFISPVACPTFM